LWWTTIQRLGSSGSKNTGTPLTERWEAVLRALASEAQLAFCFAFDPGTDIQAFFQNGLRNLNLRCSVR
jgi:hypothetical protein